ncbi:MAG: transcriptional repressor NrdR [Bdellovibrionaceae bacterium]|jgi:transcriptional repressor NrdR|nr:transcriptional repressor NrdR [Pseudobdellovibrionaceae bacterium]
MKCPHCQYAENRVLDTRIQKENEIRRRRECLKCKGRFSTIESVIVSYPHVIKKDGRREPFSKEKIHKGIQYACQKRPVSLAQIEHLVGKISKTVQNTLKREVPATFIGTLLMEELKNLDDVAYVRFASVYKTFKDIHEFVQSIDTQKEDPMAHGKNTDSLPPII